MSLGLVVVYSISPGLAATQHVSQGYFITKQLIDVALGVGAFIFAMQMPAKWWRQSAKPLLVVAAVASLLVLLMPLDAVYQAHRWLRLGGFSFQVAELIKLALLVFTAGFLTKRWSQGKLADSRLTLYPLLAILAVVGVVVAKFQSDLGSAGVMVVMLGIMAYVAGIPLKRVLQLAVIVGALFVLAIASSGYRRERLNTFFHPGSDCQASGYQACQAIIAVGSGGLVGQGLGSGVQAYGYLPQASNDSIFAIMAEKFGFIGSLAIVALYWALIARIKKVAERTIDPFMRLLTIGVLAWFSTQMIINVGAMLGLLPLKGITLPFISQGGTSLIFLTAALGIVFHVSRYTSYSPREPSLDNNEIDTPNHSFDRRWQRRPSDSYSVARPRP